MLLGEFKHECPCAASERSAALASKSPQNPPNLSSLAPLSTVPLPRPSPLDTPHTHTARPTQHSLSQVGADQFCEATVGYKNLTNGKLWQQLFDCPTFSINIIDDADGASLLCCVLLWMSASKVACVLLGLPRACFCDDLETEVNCTQRGRRLPATRVP